MTDTLANTAAEWLPTFERNFNRRDIDALVAGYTEEGVLDVGGNNVMRGRDQIRLGLENFLAPGLPIRTQVTRIIESGGAAVVLFDWSIEGDAPDGSAVKLGGSGVDVLARGTDGFWRQHLDAPFGSDTPAS